MPNSIAIIGGSGFIGRNLVEYFSQYNKNIYIISRTIPQQKLKPNVFWLQADINNTDDLVSKLHHCGAIIWLASSMIPSVKSPSLCADFDESISPIIRFLESAKDLNHLKKFIYISSGGTVYGNSELEIPISENHQKQPISSYGLTKMVSENYITFLTKSLNIQSFILRPSNVYGKYQNLKKPQGIIGFIFRAILQDTPITLFDEGCATRDFIHVDDLATAILKCLNDGFTASKTSIYNVGSQKGFTIKQISEKISFICGKSVKLIYASSRGFDCKYNVMDVSKIKGELEWQPEISIDEGLLNTWNWIKNEK